MINLNYLTTTSVLFLYSLIFLGGNRLIEDRLMETNCLEVIPLIEESKLMLPYVLYKYFLHILDWSLITASSLFAASYWYNTTEKKEEKEIKRNKLIGYLRQKYMGLGYGFIVLITFLLMWHFFSRIELGYQFKPNVIQWLGERVNSYFWLWLGLDGLSLPFVLLVSFIMPIVFFSNWTTVDNDDGYYTPIVSLLEWLLLTVFVVIDLILFYIFFESILPPLFVMIGMYGAAQKFRAGYYLFLYTLLGSLFMLLVFVKMGGDTATTYFEGYNDVNIYSVLQEITWVILFVSFSVKTPLVPVHIWLPLAHSDANVSGSIVLASVVLKLALYGFIRILIGIFTFATSKLIPFFFGLCSLSVIYSSVTTVRQFDLKVLVAYSSIAHMASSLLGTFSDTLYGLVGSIIFGLAHGFVSPGLFIIVGAILYDRCGSRIINYYRGLSNLLPFFALLFLLFVFGNMGVPLTGNFIGEFLSLLGAYQQNIFIASIGATSVILSAVYSIFMYNRVTGGSLSPFVHTIPDIFRKEFYIILPLLVLTIILGIYPSFISYDVEYGLSNYLLFVFFPAVLSDKSEDKNHPSSNSSDDGNNNNKNGSNDQQKSDSSDSEKNESEDQQKSDSSDHENKESDDENKESNNENKESDDEKNKESDDENKESINDNCHGPDDDSNDSPGGEGIKADDRSNFGDDEWSESSSKESPSDSDSDSGYVSDTESDAGSTGAVYGDDEDPNVSDLPSDDENEPNNPNDSDESDSSSTSSISSSSSNSNSGNPNYDKPNSDDENEPNSRDISDDSSSTEGSSDFSDESSSGSETEPSDYEDDHPQPANPVVPNANNNQQDQQYPPTPQNTPEIGTVVPARPPLVIPTHIEVPENTPGNSDSSSESSDDESTGGEKEKNKEKTNEEETNEEKNNENNNGKNSEESNAKHNGEYSEGHNKNNSSNTELNHTYHGEVEENGNIVKGKDEWEPIGFIYSEYDWLTKWVKVMSKLANWNNELMGWPLEIGFNNIISYLFVILLFFRLYLGYYNSMLICLDYIRFKFVLLKEKWHSFSSNFMKIK